MDPHQIVDQRCGVIKKECDNNIGVKLEGPEELPLQVILEEKNVDSTASKKVRQPHLLAHQSVVAREHNYQCTNGEFCESPFHCKYTGQCFISGSTAEKHIQIHTEETPKKTNKTSVSVATPKNKTYLCCECGKLLKSKDGLKNHQRIHTGEKPFHCSICDKYFATKGGAELHRKIHTGVKPHQCSHCGMCFYKQGDVVRHERTHTGEKSYQCSICGKCFANSSYLVKHMKSHTGEKPYPCNYCDKSFSRKDHVVLHHRLHTGEKPYQCSHCDKRFAQKVQVRLHEKVHNSTKYDNTDKFSVRQEVPFNIQAGEKNTSPNLHTHMYIHP